MALGGALVAACDQPQPKCSVARGSFAATYTLVSGSGECAALKGEILGVQSYSAPISESNPRPDTNKTSIGVQPSAITNLLAGRDSSEANPDDQPFALGTFDTATANSDGFCVVPALSVARLRLPEAPEQVDMCTTTPAQPRVDITYLFSNLQVYVSASDYGTQLVADLTYEKDGCTAVYKVRAVSPAVSCAAPATPDDAAAAGEVDDADCPPQQPDPGEQLPDDSLCEARPEGGSYVGSGINPDLDVACDPDLLLCVLSKDPPALR